MTSTCIKERIIDNSQNHRDSEMRRAQSIADNGARKLMQAFGQVPVAVREKYPAVTAQLGRVDLPMLQQTDL